MTHAEVLDRRACLERLSTVGLGRVAWASETGQVIIEPVNFVLDDDSVVFRTGEGEKLEAVRSGHQISFEADDVEPALRVGWSVLITGPAQVVSEPEDIGRLTEMGVSPWDEATPKPYLVRIRADQVTGRRLPLQPGGVTFIHTDRR